MAKPKAAELYGWFLEELRRIERKWQEAWYKSGIFNADPDPSRPKYFITVPYPYVSGPPHIGHGRTFTIADIIARYKRARGYNVLFPIAWHITGTPIQSVADRIAKGDPEDIGLYRWYVGLYVKDESEIGRILKSFTNPLNIALFFASKYVEDFKGMGYSLDLRRQFTTGDPDYNAFITWQYYKLKEQGLLTRGSHVVLYAPDEGQAVGEHDIKGGDEMTIEIVEFNLVKFRVKGEDTYLVAATLRPETIFGVTNIWVNPNATYVKALVNGEKWIISKIAAWKLKYQGYDVEELEELRGSALIGKSVEAPIVNREVPVLPANFVDDDTATGVVYSVPAHAPFDYIALIDLKRDLELCRKYGIEEIVRAIEPIPIIRVPGYGEYPAKDIIERLGVRTQEDRDKLAEATKVLYRDEYYNGVMRENTPYAGISVKEARGRIIEDLKTIGAYAVMYEVEPRRVYTRSGNRVIAAVIKDQWFLNYGDPRWKEKAFKCLNSMLIIPEKYRKNFEEVFNWLQLRPCARKRGLGTKLPWDPDWIIESLSDSTIYMAYYTVVHRIRAYEIDKKLGEYVSRVIASKGEDQEALTAIKSFFDYIFLGEGDPVKAASYFDIEPSILEELRREFEYWYPLDERHSGPDLIGSHLSFFIFHHAAIFPERLWPKAITLNEYVIREGRKMSRSLGNVLPLKAVYTEYSADLARIYMAYAADPDKTLDWREEDVASMAGHLYRFWTLVNDIISKGVFNRMPNSPSIITKWLLSKINMAIADSTRLLDNWDIRGYVMKAFFEVMNALEKYLELAKAIGLNEDEVRWACLYVLERWARLLQPVIPHLAEEIWHKLGHNTFVSLERWPEPEPQYLMPDYDYALNIVERTIDDIQEIIRVTKTTPRRIYIYVGADEFSYEIVREASRLLDAGKSMGEVIRELAGRHKERASGIAQLVKRLIEGVIPRNVPERNIEIEIFKALKGYIASRVGVEVDIQDALNPTYDPRGRAKNALPGRPAIYVE